LTDVHKWHTFTQRFTKLNHFIGGRIVRVRTHMVKRDTSC
jgi:hypothetical protein